MRVRWRGIWNQRAREKIAGGGNVIAGFVPKIRKPEQRGVKGDQKNGEENKQSRSLSRSELCLVGQGSVYGARILHMRIEFDFAERAFVIGHILMQDRRQRLRLLRA